MPVKFITCDNLSGMKGLKHGFFTNQGGVSAGIYESLNCGPGSSDTPENVTDNRTLAIDALGGGKLYSLYQIHSNKVIHLTEVPEERLQADGMVTATQGIALGILTADCTPVLFADSINSVIGACHAGWKGAIGGVIENTISEMEKIGANRMNIKAAIGPTISQESYEVGAEFYDRFIEENKAYASFFIPAKRTGHFMFNLPGFVAERLEKAGIGSAQDCALDTCSGRDNFFSYRRSCLENITDYGRNLSAIMLELE